MKPCFQPTASAAREGRLRMAAARRIGFILGAGVAISGILLPAAARAAVQHTAVGTTPATTAHTQAQPSRPQARTLAGSWQQVQNLLGADDPAAALEALDALAGRFGQEAEYRAALPQLLPLHAQLYQAAGRAGEAAQCYRHWLDLPQTQALLPQRITVFAALANACEQDGDLAGAQAALRGLVSLAPPPDVRGELAQLQIATLQARAGDTTAALAALQALLRQPGYPAPLRVQARLQAISLALQNAQDELAATVLLGEPWDSAQMPELAQLSFAAMQIAETLLVEGRPRQALRALALVTPQPQLLYLQKARRADVARALHTQQSRARAGSAQAAAAAQFLATQLAQIDKQLQFLETQEPSVAPWLHARATALLQAQRPWQAAIVFAAAADQARATAAADQARTTAAEALAIRAAYNRLLALHRAGRVQRLQSEATQFAKDFPVHPLVMQARGLQVESLLQGRRYAEALELLDTLLPADSNRTAPHRFRRGYALAMLGRYDQARADFATTAASASQPLRDWALYWQAQTDIRAANYPQAKEQLEQALVRIDPLHPAFAHTRFSHAQALYATGANAQAQAALEAFLHTWPQHEHAEAARLLLAEALIAEGETAAALHTLDALIHSARMPTAVQAALRKGAVLEQLQRPQDALAVYLDCLQAAAGGLRREAGSTTSIAEGNFYGPVADRAVRVLLAQQQRERATRLLLEVLQEQGNNPTGGDLGALIRHAFALRLPPQALVTLQHSTQSAPNSTLFTPPPNRPGTPAPAAPVAHSPTAGAATVKAANVPTADATRATPAQTAPNETLWLEAARRAALTAQLPTFYARLSLELANHYARNGRNDLQQAVLLQAATHAHPAALDTATLESVARHLAEQGHSLANTYVAQLEDRYRDQPEPAALLWAQAHQALHAAEHPQATALLERIDADWPTHPLRLSALALRAQLAHADPTEASRQWLALLAQPQSTPAQRATALLALGRLHARANDLPAAINRYQRLYTLYRAQPQPLIAAYMESAPLFEALGDLPAALATYDELLHSADIALPASLRATAEAERTRLQAAMVEMPRSKPAIQAEEPTHLQAAIARTPLPRPDVHETEQTRPQTAVSETPSHTVTGTTPHRAAANETLLPAVAVPFSDTAQAPDTTTASAQTTTLAKASVHTTTLAKASQAAAQTTAVINPAPNVASLPETVLPPATAEEAQWRQLLGSAAQVQLVYGGSLTGHVIGIEAGVLHLRLQHGGGGAGETTLPLERVLRIDFADAPAFAHTDALATGGQPALAYTRLKELYHQRERALAFASSSTLHRFAALADEALQQDEPLLAVRIASRCLAAQGPRHNTTTAKSTQKQQPDGSRIQSAPAHLGLPIAKRDAKKSTEMQSAPARLEPQLRTQLEDAELLGLWRLGLPEQAVTTARAMLASRAHANSNHRFAPASALPHAVLAAHALAAGDADAALELALTPITLRSANNAPPLSHLATAYATAIAAAEALRAADVREHLLADAAAEGIRPADALTIATADRPLPAPSQTR